MEKFSKLVDSKVECGNVNYLLNPIRKNLNVYPFTGVDIAFSLILGSVWYRHVPVISTLLY